MQKIAGGASALFRTLLERQLYNPENGLRTVGLPLSIAGRLYCVHAVFGGLSGDGDSWKLILECKGASGLKPCPKCWNVWSRDSDMAHRLAGHVEISHGIKSAFRLYTAQSLSEQISELKDDERTYSSTRFKNLKSLVGFDVSSEGVWGNQALIDDLKFPESVIFDWVHSLLQDGCFTHEFRNYAAALPAHSGTDLRNFIDGWRWTDSSYKAATRKLVRILEGGSFAGHSRPTASDWLCFCSVLRSWICLSECEQPSEAKSLMLALDLIDAIQNAKFILPHEKTPDRLAAAIDTAWEAWAQYSDAIHEGDHAKPKKHWSGHVGDSARRFRSINDTFITERLHRRAKQACDFPNTRSFEKTALTKLYIIHQQLEVNFDGIISETECVSCGRRILIEDIVFHRNLQKVGRVARCFMSGMVLTLEVFVWNKFVGEGMPNPWWSFVANGPPSRRELWTAHCCALPLAFKDHVTHTFFLLAP